MSTSSAIAELVDTQNDMNINETIFFFFYNLAYQSAFTDGLIVFFAVYFPYIVILLALVFLLFHYKVLPSSNPFEEFINRWKEIILVFFSSGLAWNVSQILKFLIHTPRPFDAFPQVIPLFSESGFAFPSGHATFFMGLAVALFFFKTEPRLNKNFESQKAFFKNHPFRLGLDLSGGTHLIYKADVSVVPSDQVTDSMNALRDVIERRINIFGVSEPVVQIQHSSLVSGAGEQLIVDLPGVTDVEKAKEMIGQTPLLEFKVEASKDATKEPQT